MFTTVLLFGPGVLLILLYAAMPQYYRAPRALAALALGCVWTACATAFVAAVNLGYVNP